MKEGIPKTVQINLRISQPEYDCLKAYSRKTRRTVTDILREYIRYLGSKT
jgi:hypothetical protein